MANIVQQFTVKATPDRVFEAVGTPEGLARWWTKSSEGTPQEGAEYTLFFGPEYDWRARVTRYRPYSGFELEITKAHPDWVGTRVGCELEPEGKGTQGALLPHRLADRKRALADFVLLLGDVFADLASQR
jgi:uncharacterized protein YndB with AHSA1/START domain